MLRIRCPKCQKLLQIDEAHIGGVLACPACTNRFRISQPKPAAPAPESPAPPPPPGEEEPPMVEEADEIEEVQEIPTLRSTRKVVEEEEPEPQR